MVGGETMLNMLRTDRSGRPNTGDKELLRPDLSSSPVNNKKNISIEFPGTQRTSRREELMKILKTGMYATSRDTNSS
jgi:hypothetical protein